MKANTVLHFLATVLLAIIGYLWHNVDVKLDKLQCDIVSIKTEFAAHAGKPIGEKTNERADLFANRMH